MFSPSAWFQNNIFFLFKPGRVDSTQDIKVPSCCALIKCFLVTFLPFVYMYQFVLVYTSPVWFLYFAAKYDCKFQSHQQLWLI